MPDNKKNAAPTHNAAWNEYLIFSKAIDLFNAFRKLKGSEDVNMDIAHFCDMIQFKLIDIYGKEVEEDGRT